MATTFLLLHHFLFTTAGATEIKLQKETVAEMVSSLLSRPRCPEFHRRLPRKCVRPGRRVEWCRPDARCMTFPENQTQSCTRIPDIARYSSAQPWGDCRGLTCHDPVPWTPLHCPDSGRRGCPEGSQCSWNDGLLSDPACLPRPMLWNAFDDWASLADEVRPRCDYFCHLPPPTLGRERQRCGLECYSGYTCVLDELGLPSCAANPRLWQNSSSALSLPAPVCQRALVSYGRNQMDHAHQLVRADRVLSDALVMQLVFVPAAAAVFLLLAAASFFLGWMVARAGWGARREVLHGARVVADRAKRMCVKAQEWC